MGGSGTQLQFRFGAPADALAVVALVESAYRGDVSRAGWTTEADLLHGQRTDAAMVLEHLSEPGRHLLLAHDGGGLVACCELTEPRVGQPAADGEHGCTPASASAGAAYLGMFAVRPTLQGGGIGRAVLAEAARIARDEWGAQALELSTLHLRAELIAWYERRGFQRTGELRAFPYGDERYGRPQRDDIVQVVLRRELSERAPGAELARVRGSEQGVERRGVGERIAGEHLVDGPPAQDALHGHLNRLAAQRARDLWHRENAARHMPR